MTKTMTIVEKLRFVPRSHTLKISKDERYMIGQVAHQAADEIERLQERCVEFSANLTIAERQVTEARMELDRRSAEPGAAQHAIAEDVRLLGVGFAMHTADGVKRLAPEDVTFRTPLRCLAMINEFGDKVCSLPESHGGSHNWVTPEKSVPAPFKPEDGHSFMAPGSDYLCTLCGKKVADHTSAVIPPCNHIWVEAIASPDFARCKRCGAKRPSQRTNV